MPTVTYPDATVQSDHALSAPARPRAFRAHLYDQSGTLAKVNHILYFVSDAGQVTEFDLVMANFCTVLGEVVPSEMQRIVDRIHGGAWKIACDRPMGRS